MDAQVSVSLASAGGAVLSVASAMALTEIEHQWAIALFGFFGTATLGLASLAVTSILREIRKQRAAIAAISVQVAAIEARLAERDRAEGLGTGARPHARVIDCMDEGGQ